MPSVRTHPHPRIRQGWRHAAVLCALVLAGRAAPAQLAPEPVGVPGGMAGCCLDFAGASPRHVAPTLDAAALVFDGGAERRGWSTGRNALVLTGVGIATLGVLWMLPENTAKWNARDRSVDAYRRRLVSLPSWDGDSWAWNYVAHPVFGMYTYLAERNEGRGPWRSFLFSTAASIAWEYPIEAWVEEPSTQDLLVTSPSGAVLGELSYRATQRLRAGGLSVGEKILLTIINPVHVVQRGWK